MKVNPETGTVSLDSIEYTAKRLDNLLRGPLNRLGDVIETIWKNSISGTPPNSPGRNQLKVVFDDLSKSYRELDRILNQASMGILE